MLRSLILTLNNNISWQVRYPNCTISSINMLKARLYKHELEKKEQLSENLAKSKTDIGWGHQIRSYVLQPYQLVKDLRNNLENTDPEDVLNGNIDEFLETALYQIEEKK